MNIITKNICRICRQSPKNIKCMITSGLLDVYTFCTNLTIVEDQEKHYKICESCIELLTRFNDFKKLCIESDDYFNRITEHEVKIDYLKDPLEEISNSELKYTRDNGCWGGKIKDVRRNSKPTIKCEHCPKVFKNRRCFEKHVKSHNSNAVSDNEVDDSNNSDWWEDPVKNVKPQHCPKTFKSYVCLEKHLNSHNSDSQDNSTSKMIPVNNIQKEEDPESKDGGKLPSNDSNSRLTKCTLCNKQMLKQCINRHMKLHERKKPSQCTICEVSFFTAKALKLHYAESHAGIKTSNCSSQLNNMPELHFECDLCKDKFKSKGSLKVHLQNHSKFDCHICKETFKNKVELKIHFLNHTETEQYTCKICKINFIHMLSLRHHIKWNHPDLQLKDCLEELNTVTEINKSKAVIKSKAKLESYPCHICGKTFKTVGGLKIHIRRHNGEKPYKCVNCDRKFVDQSQMTLHIRRDHEKLKKYKCNQCSYSTVLSTALAKHLVTHTDEKPYVCNICRAGFKTRSNLTVHRRNHTGERPYSCKFCDKSFTCSDYLRQHVSIHTGEKRFACKLCDKKFNQRTPLSKHMLMHQNENDNNYFKLKMKSKHVLLQQNENDYFKLNGKNDESN